MQSQVCENSLSSVGQKFFTGENPLQGVRFQCRPVPSATSLTAVSSEVAAAVAVVVALPDE